MPRHLTATSDIVQTGWLHKRNRSHAMGSPFSRKWSRRFFTLDQRKGTLSYRKTVSGKPSTIIPLMDISAVKELGGCAVAIDDWSDGEGLFSIRVHGRELELYAGDAETRKTWVANLRRVVEVQCSEETLSRKCEKSGAPMAATTTLSSRNSWSQQRLPTTPMLEGKLEGGERADDKAQNIEELDPETLHAQMQLEMARHRGASTPPCSSSCSTTQDDSTRSPSCATEPPDVPDEIVDEIEEISLSDSD